MSSSDRETRADRILDGLREHEGEREPPSVPDRYRLLDELGRGGMAVVYRARDLTLDREVAIKLMRDDLGVDGEAEARFRREVEVTARLQHPNVVTVFDAGPNFLVMELVEGETLADRMDAARERMDNRAAAALMERVACGVHAAHELGIVHRDLKPSNILLPRNTGSPGAAADRPKVADFGVAHLAGDVTRLTVSGMVVGTPRYMAPEQVASKKKTVTPRTDVYALGAILYELVTGQSAHVGETPMAVFGSIMHEEPVRPRSIDAKVPTDLETIVLKALEKDPARRYGSAEAFAADLARWRAGDAIDARPPSLFYRLKKRVARRKGVVIASTVGVVALAIALSVFLVALGKSERTLSLWRRITAVLADADLYGRAGDVVRAGERLERGVVDCRTFLASDDVADAHYFLGRLLRAQRKRDAALVALDRAVALDASLAEARFERGLLLVEVYESGQFGVLVAGHRRGGALAVPPKQLESMHPKLAALGRRAVADLSVELGESRYVRDIDAIYGRAELARMLWEWDAARREFERVLAREPLYARAWLGLAKVASDLREWDEAIGEAGRAIDVDAGLGEAYAVRGRARFWKNEASDRTDWSAKAQAALIADLDRAIELLGEHATALRVRGTVRSRAGDLDRALVDLNRAIEIAPRDARAFNQRGWVHQSRGAYTDAVADFTEAVMISPRFATAWANRAQTRVMQGDTEGALHDARKALEVAREEDGQRERLQSLVDFLQRTK